MSKTTDCKKCIFNSEEDWCSFGVPESISKTDISINSDTKIIYNYSCYYAFGKETFEANKDKYSIEDIKQYILNKNQIKYTIVVNFDTIGVSPSEIIDTIYSCSFLPKNVVCFGKNVDSDTVSTFDKDLKMPWKVNKILPHIDEVIAIISGVDVITDKHESKAFLYISSKEMFNNLDTIMNTIHIESVINNNHGIFMQNVSTLDGLFMTYGSYNILGGDKGKFFYTPSLFFQDNPDCKLILYND